MTNPMRFALVCLAGLAIGLGGCDRTHSKAAIQEAIEAHLKQAPGLTLSNMTTEVQEVKFDRDQATAEVAFQSKQVPELKVEVRYVLRRQGNAWVVESSTPMSGQGASPHGPAGHPGAGGTMDDQSVPATPPAEPPPQASH